MTVKGDQLGGLHLGLIWTVQLRGPQSSGCGSIVSQSKVGAALS